jgi:hypothetical protein
MLSLDSHIPKMAVWTQYFEVYIRKINDKQNRYLKFHTCITSKWFAYWGVESKLGPLGTSATEWPIVLAPCDYDDGEFNGIKIGRGNRNTRRKPAPAPLCPPQIPLDQTRVWTRAAVVGSQRLTAWAMARPLRLNDPILFHFGFQGQQNRITDRRLHRCVFYWFHYTANMKLQTAVPSRLSNKRWRHIHRAALRSPVFCNCDTH